MNLYTDFDAMTENPEWLGFGYIGTRRHLGEADRSAGDALVLKFAAAQGWSDADLFEWANSKSGRYFADSIDGGDQGFAMRELSCYLERMGVSLSGGPR